MESLLSVFGVDWKLLIAQTINFLILFAGLSYLLYRPVMKMLAERQATIAKGVKDAEAAALAAKETEAARSGIITEANKNAEAIVSRAEAEGKKERVEIVHAAQERSDALLAEARAQATELERQALLKSEKEIARAAILAAEKILEKQA
ncbi:hypothetical protein A2841_01675 [Candidatus Kaiserbacteria bacterium RIFCSPHIGHO2_01_FULL_48_10]|uniref:ATP synthase subunit b n=1 Tax=Candidatus Kaiserbacteria bacterium RIFCSPHIGHO2_01_FULL_48_10 TaxID=1798476 RepID=A0A1F6C1X8_9BACT|nr:MAG: hypothetical protein A2841_01675 [Candidatus Kaiserbacteria bacterium RIFCSPHIGHO2_01_FULL_48_10]